MHGYSLFSKFYRELANGVKLHELEVEVLKELFKRYGVAPSSRILDAACGTGDVALMLHDAGFTKMSASDGSAEMLDEVEGRQRDVMSVDLCEWTQLEDLFRKHGRFDVVYITGHALPHLPFGEFPVVARQVYEGLNPGGLFLFDIRQWEPDHHGELREAGRLPNVDKMQGVVHVDGKEYWVENSPTYDRKVQTIMYRLTDVHNPRSPALSTQVSYSIYTHDEAADRLRDAGFPKSGIEVKRHGKWPYLLVVAKRS
jgi:SAM-dependent methyltransferase